MTTWYVTETGAGLKNGTSLSNAYSAADFNTGSSWSGIAPGDTINLSGEFTTRLAPQGSGSSVSNRITLKGINGNKLVGINGANYNYMAVISCSFTQFSSSNAYPCITIEGANGWLIEDNRFYNTYGSAFDAHYDSVNNNNIFRCNVIENCTGATSGSSEQPNIEIFGDNNLVEYNSIIGGLDRVRFFGEGNIARNNYFGPTDTINYPNTDTYPHHIDDFQSYGSTRLLTKLLFERNYSEGNVDSVGRTNGHHALIKDTADEGMEWIVSRFNVLNETAGVLYTFREVDNIWLYNLTSRAVYSGSATYFNTSISWETSSALGVGAQFRNLTYYNCYRCKSPNSIISSNFRNTSSYFSRIHAYNDSGSQVSLPDATDLNNLPQTDPSFVDGYAGDFRLQPTSLLINSGSYLTLATGSGINSTELVVNDASGIVDGWSIVDKDWIKVGSSSYAQVSSINYTTNTITLSTPLTWTHGDWVSVMGMEDVGALPYNYTYPVSILNTSSYTELKATSSVSSSIRYVEFRVNGNFVGQTTGSNGEYIVDYTTSDGDIVEARAFSLWASRTPYINESVTITSGSSSPETGSNVPYVGGNGGGGVAVSVENKLRNVNEILQTDPYVQYLFEEMEQLRRDKKLTLSMRLSIENEIAGRINHLLVNS